MIALYDHFKDDLNGEVTDESNQEKHEKGNKSVHTRSKMQTLLQKLQRLRTHRKQHKADRLALNQLMQLDNALLKDMGIRREELNAVKKGALSFDALIKHEIASTRDNASYSQMSQKVQE